jgi:hypothetical protein
MNREHQSGGITARARSGLWLQGDDWSKSACCYCKSEIGPNAPRVTDRWGNFFCDNECRAYAMAAVHRMHTGSELPEPTPDAADWAEQMVANEVVNDG